jgi:hypothetical protein
LKLTGDTALICQFSLTRMFEYAVTLALVPEQARSLRGTRLRAHNMFWPDFALGFVEGLTCLVTRPR